MKASVSGLMVGLLVAFATAGMPVITGMDQEGAHFAKNAIVVAFTPQYAPLDLSLSNGVFVTGLAEVDRLNQQFGVTYMWPLFPKAERYGEFKMAGYYSITFGDRFELEAVLDAYDDLGVVDHVEPVGVHRIHYIPDDPSLNQQWGLTNVHAREAWDISWGNPNVILGIPDSGVDWDHPDLAADIWMNEDEILDGTDSDGNGYIDDIRGWDWVHGVNGAPGEDSWTPDNNPMDFSGHGTHCSGIAAACTDNGVGIAGLGFDCRIMALRIGWMDPYGQGWVRMDFAASAFYYAVNNGAHVLNCSWGSSSGLATATNYAVNHGVLIVTAAGNENNQSPSYLGSRSDVISVAATNSGDQKAWFSSYGTWVEVSAPGVAIYSTVFNNSYTSWDGTSMAAPFVTGLAGLLFASDSTLTAPDVFDIIVSSTDNIDSLNPGYEGLLGSGRINAYTALGRDLYPNIQLVEYYVTLISDDGDGVVNPGESIELVVVLQNLWQDAYSVVATLSAPEGITVIDSVTEFGDFEGNGEYMDNNSDPFELSFAEEIIPGQYDLTLLITADGDYTNEIILPIGVTLEMAGFPVSLDGAIESHPLIFDFDADGQNEIIVGCNNNKLYAIEADGSFSPGWPVMGSGDFNTAACVGDIYGDGDFEVVACSKDGQIYAWDEGGDVLDGFPVNINSMQVFANPTLADLDDNGDLEIIQPGFLPTKSIYIINHDGSNFGSWPYVGDDPWYSGVAVGDIDDDNQLEVVIGGLDNKLHVFNVDMTEVDGWPFDVGEDIKVAPAIGNIDPSDPEPEIVVGTNSGSIYLFNHDGTVVNGWPIEVGGQIRSAPSLADLDDDGSPEIIIGSGNANLYVYDADGSLFSGFPVTLLTSINASAAVGDISGDGSPDIIIANGSINSLIYAFDTQGQLLGNFPMPTVESGQISATPAIWDIDYDGDMEVVVGVQTLGQNLDVIDYKEQALLTDMQWPAYGNDIYRSCNYIPLFPYTDVPEEPVSLPLKFSLSQNYPNPFNSKTVIRFSLDRPGDVSLEVFNILGRKVKTLITGFKQAGRYEVVWDGRNSERSEVASGIYFYRLKTGDNILVRRMAYLR